ncbi:LysR family transcriptional regulator [Roseomonas rosulenta]|uniref:LysR family transcriptional regulator n=1 Tax=Roseomonas rosulenta TaxID=2748667 RepID=UPI0018E01F31|nr:LysR family transcriptional regulator [Roseomonas rosulenta]
MTDRFDALAAFVAVAEAQGFAAAARRMGLSPSAVTRLVAGLEDRLGLLLLQRTTRRVSLTDAGSRFLPRARRVLDDLREAEDSAAAEHAAPTGHLVVAAPVVFGRLHAGPLVCDFLSRHPAVTAELTLSDRNIDLLEEGVDVALRIGRLDDSALVSRRVGVTRRVWVAAPGYLAQAGLPLAPEDLDRHRLIHCTALGAARAWRFHRGGVEEVRGIAPRYATNSVDAALWHAVQGGGVTMALAYQAEEALRAGRLALVLQDFEPEPLPIQFVYPSARLLSAKVRALVDLAVQTRQWRFMAAAAPA